jgi:hypothetical protein
VLVADHEKKAKLAKKNDKGVILSLEDEKKILELSRKKITAIEELPPKYQRRIRTALNEERKQHNQSEIHYHEINPMHPSYNKKLAQLLVHYYNDTIDKTIHDITDQQIYEHELHKVQKYTKEKLNQQVQHIPHDVQHEIIQLLELHPQSITAQKKDVQQKIIATFNTFY